MNAAAPTAETIPAAFPIDLLREEMVGDLGIEPSMGFPGGVTVRCRTLQPVALPAAACANTRQPERAANFRVAESQSNCLGNFAAIPLQTASCCPAALSLLVA